MLHTPGSLGELPVSLPQKSNPAPLPTWWGQGEGLCSRKERSLSEERRAQATTPEPPSQAPHPQSPPPAQLPIPISWKNRALLSAPGKQETWVNLMFPFHRLSSCGIGGACAQRGRRGAWASPSWHPSHSRRAGRAGAPSQAVTQRAGYSCGSQL